MPTSETLSRIHGLVAAGRVVVSAHGYDELAADGILFGDAVAGLNRSVVVEDYPNAAKGPSVLLLQRDLDARPIHVVWGIAKGTDGPAVLITAYRPDPSRWSLDFLERRK